MASWDRIYEKEKASYISRLETWPEVAEFLKEKGITHYAFNKRKFLSLFKNFRVEKLWVEYGKESWEKYYCLIAQKRQISPD